MERFSYVLWFLILKGSVRGQPPSLEPPTSYFCPGVNVTYTCHDNQVDLMSWSAEPYISGKNIINFSPGFIHFNNDSVVFMKATSNNFFSNLTTIMFNSDNPTVANITTTLTVITRGLDNRTNITCLTNRQLNMSQSSSILYFADMPNLRNVSVTYQKKDTAVLELGDMFYGGGVPIDHYIIQVENGTQLETPGPTYSFDIMYNTSLSVNISAHNCAGYSDPFPLVLQYNEDKIEKNMPEMTPSSESTDSLLTWLLAVLLVTGIIIITLLVVFVYLLRSCIKHIKSSEEKCDVVENSAYGVTVQGSAGDRLEPDYNMENNPLYEMRSLSNDRHSHKTQTPAPAAPVYETIDTVVL